MTKFAIATGVLLAASIGAQAQMKPEDQLKQRKSAYAIIGSNFASLAAMAQEKKPFNKEEAARNAQLVAALADYPRGFFGEGTDKGETKAKPEIWQKRQDFDAKMDKFIQVARTLPQNVGDLGAVKKAVADTGAACKACHDDYRAK
jgi:cytochrome c556